MITSNELAKSFKSIFSNADVTVDDNFIVIDDFNSKMHYLIELVNFGELSVICKHTRGVRRSVSISYLLDEESVNDFAKRIIASSTFL